MIEPGMKIKIFPETDVKAYTQMIRDNGYHFKLYKDYIQVGEKSRLKIYDGLKLGPLLKKARRKKGLTRSQMAKLINVSECTIYHWEIGMHNPEEGSLQKFCEVTGITKEEIESCKF